MLKNIISILLMISCLTLITMASWALDFESGKYEITSRMEMPGMPAAIPPQTIVQCMTDQDPIPNSNPENQDCKITDMQQTKTTVSWEMECIQQGQKMTSTGQMTYKGDTFEGTIKTNLGPDAGNMTMTTVITGKRLSDCK
jgi:hypothetical protein